MKKILSVLLVACMVFAMSTTAFAGQVTTTIGDVQITAVQLTDSSMLVTENDVTSLITVDSTNLSTTTTIKDLKTGETDYFIHDYENNTLYSSITGYTGTVETTAVANDSIGWHKIPYSELALYVGAGAAATDVLAFITSKCGLVALSLVLEVLSKVMSVITAGLLLGGSSKGVKYEVGYVTITKHQAGRVIYVDVKRVVDVATY